MRSKYFRFLISLVILIAAVIAAADSVSAASVKGVPDEYKSEINYLIDRGVIEGYPDGSFHGKDQVTREQAATMVGRALKLDGKERRTKFPDVSPSSFASGYIQSAAEAGVIKGYPDGTFKPKDIMTRGEMAYLISNAFHLKETSNVSYHDVSKSSDVYHPINLLTTAGISEGVPGGRFLPNKEITRTEFSLFLARAMDSRFKVSGGAGDDKVIVDTDVLNVRSGPSTSYKIVGKVHAADVVSVLEDKGTWAYISAGSIKGYISLDYTIPVPSDSWKVALDPGHGGQDPGAQANGLTEKDVVLDVALRTRTLLEDAGINVVMTRDSDTFPALTSRAPYAIDHGADSFVSVHANAYPNGTVDGVETFYYASGLTDREYKSYRLATFINDRLYKAMDMDNRGVKNVGYKVIKETTLPSVLTEIGFLTNSGDAAKLKQSHYRNQASEAIMLGVADYYNWREGN